MVTKPVWSFSYFSLFAIITITIIVVVVVTIVAAVDVQLCQTRHSGRTRVRGTSTERTSDKPRRRFFFFLSSNNNNNDDNDDNDKRRRRRRGGEFQSEDPTEGDREPQGWTEEPTRTLFCLILESDVRERRVK